MVQKGSTDTLGDKLLGITLRFLQAVESRDRPAIEALTRDNTHLRATPVGSLQVKLADCFWKWSFVRWLEERQQWWDCRCTLFLFAICLHYQLFSIGY